MKQIFFSFLLLLSCMAFSISADAQNCDGQRYFNSIFASYDSSTVVYSADGMTMDIYQPHGDTATNKKTILLIHGGNFYQGSSTDKFIYNMCQFFVQKGYVTASINYPLITPTQILNYALQDSATAYPIIAQSISEGKAAVRYLKKNAATLGIDSAWIVIGGESSGALIADHVAYMNDLSGVSPLLDSAFTALGGIEGNSGNPGFSSGVKAVLNYGGGLLDLNMLTSLDHTPIYTAQGDSDHNVPFGCGTLFGNYTDYTACGGGSMQPVLSSLGITNQLLFFDSLDYSPWADSTMAQTGDTNHLVLTQVKAQSTLFLYQLDCPTFTGINDITNVKVALYPNPASTLLHIRTEEAMESIEIIDRMGRSINVINSPGSKAEINISGMSAGIYLARIIFKENRGSAVRSFVIE